MIEVNVIQGVPVLSLDEVRMNPARAEAVRKFCTTDIGMTCKAFVFDDAVGTVDKVELWGGSEIQHDAFVKNLKHELRC